MSRPSLSPTVLDTEQRLQLFIECVHDYALLMLDAAGNIVSWNAGAALITGYKAEEIIGRHFSTFYSKDEILAGKPAYELEVAAEAGRFEDTGFRIRKDGSRYWANVIITAIRDARGRLVGYGKITRDISDRRESERKLQESEAKLQMLVNTVLDTVVDGLVVINRFGIIQFCNPACVSIFGHDLRELIGKNVKMLFTPAAYDEYQRYLAEYRRTGDRHVLGAAHEIKGCRKDGTKFPMELSVGEAKMAGESIFVGIIRDVTERKRTEEQLVQAQKMETVGQLSGGIAHDFNNLLTVIIGNADCLSERLGDLPELKQLCESIIVAGMRGAELTQRLLAFSRRQALKPVAIDCNAMVENLQELLRRTLREDVEIRSQLSLPSPTAFADIAQLESALINLSLNAQDAMPKGGHLTISTAVAELDEASLGTNTDVKPGHYVMIAVTDDGVGMAPEIVEHVFEPFFTTKEVGKGSGLGLSMVYGFIKQSDGHVALYSEPGLGTTIRMYLPVDASGKPASDHLLDAADGEPPRGSETVLVTEDDPFVRGYAVSCLESLGYTVITAANGGEALARLSEGATPDVLFTDVIMPGGVSGWDLARQARKLCPGLKLLMTSGYALETLVSDKRLPPDAVFVNKPYRKNDLARSVRLSVERPGA